MWDNVGFDQSPPVPISSRATAERAGPRSDCQTRDDSLIDQCRSTTNSPRDRSLSGFRRTLAQNSCQRDATENAQRRGSSAPTSASTRLRRQRHCGKESMRPGPARQGSQVLPSP